MRKILLSICIFALAVSLSLFAGAAQIGSADELLTLMNTPSMWADDYTLTADINLSDATNGLSQAPIGSESIPYSGIFDGDGYTISGINISGAGNVALFGFASGATIKNLTVEGTVSSTTNWAAGIIARVSAASITVENCVNRCTVSGVDAVGGIVGRLEPGSLNATISGCKNEGTITGARYSGGIVGFSSQTSGATVIEKCQNDGVVNGTQGVAGIVGFFRVYTGSSGKCYVQDCINTGKIHATTAYAGGILGWGHNKNYAYTVTHCFNSGSVTSDKASYVRPIAGVISKATYTAGNMNACYYTTTDAYTAESDCYANLCETYASDATVAANLAGLGENFVVADGYAPQLKNFHTHDYKYSAIGAEHKYACYCGDVKLTEGHNFVNGVCDKCGVEDIPCTHDNKYEIVENAATCASVGSKYEFCPDCQTKVSGDIEIAIDVNNHSGTLTMVLENGAVTYLCSDCDAAAYTDNSLLDIVYVSQTGAELKGNVSSQIGTSANPFKNFTDAMQYAALVGKDVTVTILDTAEVPEKYHTPEFESIITVTGGTLITHTRFIMHGPMVFEHICFKDSGNPFIAAQEHKIVMGEGITVSGGGIYLVGGYENGTATNSDIPATGYSTDVTVRSGVYHGIAGANRYLGGTYSGDTKVVLGKTNPSDTLKITSSLAVVGFNSEGGDGVNATFIFDGDVDEIASFYPISHASNATGRFDIDIVVRGGATLDKTKVIYRGANATVNVYSDSRVEGADELAATITDADKVQPYRRYCLKVNGEHPDANSDGICDNCGSSTACEHIDGEWQETMSANCAEKAVYTWYCYDCQELITDMTKEGETTNADNHVADSFVWNNDGEKYYFVCNSCGVKVEQTDAPSVYVSLNGSDKNDGRTAEKAVKTLAEAVTRIANVGGMIVIVSNYALDGDVVLPAYTKPISFVGYDADDGYVPGGFTASANVVISLGGKTSFDDITFAGGKRYTIVANWNDITFGRVYSLSDSYSYVVLGGYPITESDNEAKSATLTITEDVTRARTLDGTVTRDRFYTRIYLGSVFGADNIGVANKSATLNATNADIGVLYTMSTSGSHKLTTAKNCETTVNLYGRATVNQGRTGDFNVAYATSKGSQKNLTLNLFDNSAILTNYYIRNCENTVINVSTKADGRTFMIDIPFTFYSFGDFAANGTAIHVEINYGEHGFAPSLDTPCVFVDAADEIKIYEANAVEECEYVESIAHAATPKEKGIKHYSCTCGRYYDEEYEYSCDEATHIYTAYTDGSFKCSVCEETFTTLSENLVVKATPMAVADGKASVNVNITGTFAAALVSITAPEGFELADAALPENAELVFAGNEADGVYSITVMSASGADKEINETFVLTYSVADSTAHGSYILDVAASEVYNATGEVLCMTPVSAEIVYAEEKVIGDVNGDGIVTIADALVIIRAVLNDISLPNADLNGDGKVGLVDVIRAIKLISQ